MYCKKCGTKNEGGSKICSNCGDSLLNVSCKNKFDVFFKVLCFLIAIKVLLAPFQDKVGVTLYNLAENSKTFIGETTFAKLLKTFTEAISKLMSDGDKIPLMSAITYIWILLFPVLIFVGLIALVRAIRNRTMHRDYWKWLIKFFVLSTVSHTITFVCKYVISYIAKMLNEGEHETIDTYYNLTFDKTFFITFGLSVLMIIVCEVKRTMVRNKAVDDFWHCHKCSHINSDISGFCTNCGSAKPSDVRVGTTWVCECGVRNDIANTHCLRCGKLNPASTEELKRRIL